MLDWIFSSAFLAGVISYAIPVIFAASASFISVRAGISAINIEGAMSMAAVAGALTSHFTGSWALGLLAAAAAGVLMMLFLSFAAQTLHADSFLSGIALNTFATGACVLVLTFVLGVKGDSSSAPSCTVPDISIPLLCKIPVIGQALFGQNLLFYLMLLCLFALWIFLYRTREGVYIRTLGYHEDALRSVGVSVKSKRCLALMICGALAGLGGAYLSMANLGYFSAGMVSGRGFIGIAAEAMGAGNLWLTGVFSLLFGAVDYFAVGAQTVISFPYELLNILPYLMTLIALVIYSLIRKKNERQK